MPSSVIRDASYDDTTREMRVTFVSGRIYVYRRRARSIYDAFSKAPSKGAFFNVAIRGRYHFHELAASHHLRTGSVRRDRAQDR